MKLHWILLAARGPLGVIHRSYLPIIHMLNMARRPLVSPFLGGSGDSWGLVYTCTSSLLRFVIVVIVNKRYRKYEYSMSLLICGGHCTLRTTLRRSVKGMIIIRQGSPHPNLSCGNPAKQPEHDMFTRIALRPQPLGMSTDITCKDFKRAVMAANTLQNHCKIPERWESAARKPQALTSAALRPCQESMTPTAEDAT